MAEYSVMHSSPSQLSRRAGISGFTLVELLVTVAIVALLASLVLPAVNRMRDEAKKGACVMNLRLIGAATQMIVGDDNGSLPGVGKRTANASATWQDTLNVLAFNNPGRDPLQRIGDTKQPGQMYCPAMQKWPAGGTRSPRAYTMNKYVQDSDPNAEVIPNYGGLIDYVRGRKIAAFAHPQSTIMVAESERSGDYLQPNPTYGQLTLGDGNNAPIWASTDQYWAFRHNMQINVLFLDGHVQTFTFNDAKKLNDPVYFNPASQ